MLLDPAEKREKQAFSLPSECCQEGAGVQTSPSQLWVLMLDVEALGLLAGPRAWRAGLGAEHGGFQVN